MSEFRRYDAKLKSTALRHVAPQHVERVLEHYAISLAKAKDDGRMTKEQIDALTFDQHDAAIASVARDNPHVRRPPDPPRAPLPTITRGDAPGDYTKALEQGKKASHGSK